MKFSNLALILLGAQAAQSFHPSSTWTSHQSRQLSFSPSPLAAATVEAETVATANSEEEFLDFPPPLTPVERATLRGEEERVIDPHCAENNNNSSQFRCRSNTKKKSSAEKVFTMSFF